jgi:hypothetical protein
MKSTLKILALIFLLGVIFVIGVLEYYSPPSYIGGIYLKSKYRAEEQDLKSISEHLEKTNGGRLPENIDHFLFNKLANAKKDSTEYKNILGFYAYQSISGKAGMKIFEDGSKYLPSIIQYGRTTSSELRQEGYLFLAYGIAQKRPAYAPTLISKSSMDEKFTFIEEGNLSAVGIGSYKP